MRDRRIREFIWKTKQDTVSSSEIYYGETYEFDALITANKWRIYRDTTNSGVTTRQYADNGTFGQRWDQRTTYFDEHTPDPDPVDPSESNNSLLFPGVGTYVNFGDNYAFTRTDSFSISMWVMPKKIGIQALWSRTTNDASASGYAINLTATNTIQIYTRPVGTGVEQQTTPTVLNTNLWHHIVVTYDGTSNLSGFKVYLNGVLDYTGTNDAVAGTWVGIQNAQLGARGDNAINFYGYMDEVSVFTSAISQDAITALYNAGTPTTVSGAAGWWRMGDGDDTATTLVAATGSVNGSLVNFPASPYATETPP